MASQTKTQWPGYMKEAYRILKPGTGWIQCAEFEPFYRCDDGSVPEDAALYTVILFIPEIDCSFKITQKTCLRTRRDSFCMGSI
jgi:hypothetical protein